MNEAQILKSYEMARERYAALGVDTDKAIEMKYHTSIQMFFNRYGEKAFRIIESQMLKSTAELDNTVISTGGGTSCSDENIDFILNHGTAIYLEMSVDDIMQRISKAHRTRPALSGKSLEEQHQFISEQLETRLKYYRQAPLSLPALNATPEQIVQLLRDNNIIVEG